MASIQHLQQRSGESLLPTLHKIFRASVVFSYIQLNWRTTKMLFIPKYECSKTFTLMQSIQANQSVILPPENLGETSGLLHPEETGFRYFSPQKQVYVPVMKIL